MVLHEVENEQGSPRGKLLAAEMPALMPAIGGVFPVPSFAFDCSDGDDADDDFDDDEDDED